MELVAGLEVADDPVQVLERDLADDHPVLVLVDDPADAAQALVDRLPVLVVAARCAGVVAQQRVLGDLVDGVEPQPSTPRSNQKRITSCIAASTSGLSQSRSGCSRMNECRYHWPVASSKVHAGPTALNCDVQSLGTSRQTYQSRLGSSRELREAWNHGCWSEVWFGTQSMTIRMPRAWHSATRWSKSSSVPKIGSTSR